MDGVEAALGRFLQDLRRLEAPAGARGILVAASGGADSTALARLFALARERGGPEAVPELWLGHLHHGIRGEEADRDAEFVRDLALKLGARFLEAREDVPALARAQGLSLEAAARRARYGCFERWCRERPVDLVALGHTASDQAETVVLRILRGAGPRGLCGMPAARPLSRAQAGPFPRLIRPLLGVFRAEVLALLEALGQPFREDCTNRDTSILRNRIRHRLLPLLRAELHPEVDSALLEAARRVREAWAVIEAAGREAFEGALCRSGPGWVELDRGQIARLPAAVRYHALERAAGSCQGATEGPRASPRALGDLSRSLAEESGEPRAFDLGGGLRAQTSRRTIVCRTQAPAEPEAPPPVALRVPGSARWGGWELRADPTESGETRAQALRRLAPGGFGPEEGRGLAEAIDGDSIEGGLEVRSRRPGDRFRPLGAPGSKKLKEFLRERGVGPARRDAVPLVACARGIVWVVGHRIGEPYRVRPESRKLLLLRAFPGTPRVSEGREPRTP